MRIALRATILIVLLQCFSSLYLYAQFECKSQVLIEGDKSQYIVVDSGRKLLVIGRGVCKNYSSNIFENELIGILEHANPTSNVNKTSLDFIKIHGNVLYSFTYRSYVDTPYSENSLMQHFVQTNLNVLIKNRYPVRISISNRTSNSNYFRDATDVTLQFNRQQLLDNIKNRLNAKINSSISYIVLQQLEAKAREYRNKVEVMQNWLSSPERLQEIVEEKERNLRAKVNGITEENSFLQKDSILNGSRLLNKSSRLGLDVVSGKKNLESLSELAESKFTKLKDSASNLYADTETSIKDTIENYDSSIIGKIEAKKQWLETVKDSLKQYEVKVKTGKKIIGDSIGRLRKEIGGLRNVSSLMSLMKKYNISKDSVNLSKAEILLLSINKIGLGRSWIDYSELTVKNISLNGVNIEMNPSPYYLAVAAGKVNYRFRDFILKTNERVPKQSLALIRAGVGDIGGKNVIVTLYGGKKDVLQGSNSLQSVSKAQDIFGLSIETRYPIAPNTFIIAEVAKSSNEVIRSTKSKLETALDFKQRGNEAYSIKLNSSIPETNTKISGFYRKMGQYFQSFNMYPMGNNQEAFMARITQSFYNKKITLDAAIRRNDFTNQFVAGEFSSKTTFKSIQLTARIPKYPFVSLGYYPTTQLSVMGNNELMENQYNTLNAVVNHSYSFLKTSMNTGLLFTKFFNKSQDTGFIYYNTASYSLNHSVLLRSFNLQGTASLIDQSNIHLITLEPSISYSYKNRVSASTSFKWNRLNKSETLFGGTAGIGINLRKIGSIQLQYDKSWLPGYSSVLVPVEIGRINFYREF